MSPHEISDLMVDSVRCKYNQVHKMYFIKAKYESVDGWQLRYPYTGKWYSVRCKDCEVDSRTYRKRKYDEI